MKKILITGGLGYIGSHVAAKLVSAGAQVTVLDDLSNASHDNHNRLEKLCGTPIALYEVDIARADAVAQAFSNFQPDCVVHCAGRKSIGESWRKPLTYYDVNVTGTVNVLQAMDQVGCTSMVFSSSAAIYGTPQHLPVDETHPIMPVNPYGRSKATAEQVIADWQQLSSDRTAILLRYYNPVGAHESLLIGEAPSQQPNNLFPVICDIVHGAATRLDIFGDDYDTDDGTGARDYIHVEDLAEAHHRALQRLASGELHILNLGTGRATSVLQIVSLFEAVAGSKIPKAIVTRRKGDVASVVADNAKSLEALGDYVTHGLEDAVQTSFNFSARRN